MGKKSAAQFYKRRAKNWSNLTLDDIVTSNSKKKMLKLFSETCCMDKKDNYKYIKVQKSFQSHALSLWLIPTTWILPIFEHFFRKKIPENLFFVFLNFSYVFGVLLESVELKYVGFTIVWMFTEYWKNKIDISKGSIFELLTPPWPTVQWLSHHHLKF